MSEPARPLTPAPPEPLRALETLIPQAIDAYRQACEVMAPGVADVSRLEVVARMTELDHAIRTAAGALIFAGARAASTAPEPAPAPPLPRRAGARHARQGGFWPRVVQGAVPVAAFAAARHTASHGLKVKTLAATGVAAGLTGVVALGAGHSAIQPYERHIAVRAPAAAPAPGLFDAVPVTSPSSYQPRHGGGTTQAATASRAPKHRRAPAVTVTPAPGPSPSPAPPSPAPSPSVAGGTLQVQEQQVTIGPSGQAVLDLYAQGGDVQWSASLPGGITLLADGVPEDGDTLAAGTSGQVTVAVDPSLTVRPGSAVVTIGGQQVTVTWS